MLGGRKLRLHAMGSSPQPIERRHFGRRQTCVHATIVARGRSPIPCVMRDVSEGGRAVASRPSGMAAGPLSPDHRGQRLRGRLRDRASHGQCRRGVLRGADASPGLISSGPAGPNPPEPQSGKIRQVVVLWASSVPLASRSLALGGARAPADVERAAFGADRARSPA